MRTKKRIDLKDKLEISKINDLLVRFAEKEGAKGMGQDVVQSAFTVLLGKGRRFVLLIELLTLIKRRVRDFQRREKVEENYTDVASLNRGARPKEFWQARNRKRPVPIPQKRDSLHGPEEPQETADFSLIELREACEQLSALPHRLVLLAAKLTLSIPVLKELQFQNEVSKLLRPYTEAMAPKLFHELLEEQLRQSILFSRLAADRPRYVAAADRRLLSSAREDIRDRARLLGAIRVKSIVHPVAATAARILEEIARAEADPVLGGRLRGEGRHRADNLRERMIDNLDQAAASVDSLLSQERRIPGTQERQALLVQGLLCLLAAQFCDRLSPRVWGTAIHLTQDPSGHHRVENGVDPGLFHRAVEEHERAWKKVLAQPGASASSSGPKSRGAHS